MPYQCDSEDGNKAVLLVTDLSDGSVLAFCPYCVHPYFSAMAEATAPEPAAVDLEPEAQEGSGWDGPPALDVYPPGDPRNADPAPTPEVNDGAKGQPRKRAPRKVAASKV